MQRMGYDIESSAGGEQPTMAGHYWRNLRCEGCPLSCSYRDFKVFGSCGFRETVQSLFVASEDPADWRYKRRRTILGIMHAHKRELWEQYTASCPNWGLTAEDLAVMELTELVLDEARQPTPLAAEEFAEGLPELDGLGDVSWGKDEVPF